VIGGKPVHFVLDSADDQADPRTGTTVAQKLVDDGIKGMLGHFNSGTTIPASRIYANAGIPEVAMATAPEYTQQGFKTTFRMMTSDTQQGSVAGNVCGEERSASRRSRSSTTARLTARVWRTSSRRRRRQPGGRSSIVNSRTTRPSTSSRS
jgi:hypothetical protein